ncbi:expressed unknown protein [Seminavis robusta]|uniref:Uncharacterized protein n=1 Tax=Seminavis robusta TaxID=568900 RepID=A0A9N8HQZ6_9STRA|nr:expressed unknown protein [Seminavis robusta]|eukprot:Sro1209_g252660.1 n/a (356) ;mRNA; r:16988-18055
MTTTSNDEAIQNDVDDTAAHAGTTEAGIVRGVSRSVAQRAVAARTAGRGLAQLPSVGSLPRSAARRTRVPVRQVAKLTDRMSTGLDVWESASGSGGSSSATDQQSIQRRFARAQAFAGSLVKNTVLGALVFETYCGVVAHSDTILSSIIHFSPHRTNGSDEGNIDHTSNDDKDIFEAAPIPIHFLAGAAAGSMQGIGGIIWDTTSESISNRKMSMPKLPLLTSGVGQHAAAHSVLFGSYESFKRSFLWAWQYWDPEVNQQVLLGGGKESFMALLPHQRLEYLSVITMAGGLAGQFQHVISYALEQPRERRLVVSQALPSLRSMLWAFPPSAIAFLAFEYGKDSVAGISGEDEEVL